MPDIFTAEQWHYAWCKGKAESYIAKEKESISKVVKTLKTAVRKGTISERKLKSILAEVERDTVEAFRQYDFYTERRNRLDELRKSLGI